MTKLLRAAALAAALTASCAAHATSYVFSYTFASGDQLTGAFDGTASGDLISDLSNFAVSFAGTPLSGSLLQYGIDWEEGYIAAAGVASFSGTANNLIITNTPFDADPTAASTYITLYSSAAYSLAQVSRLPPATSAFDGTTDYSAVRWNVTAVPEPETYGMLLAGLALVGAAARRRPHSR